MRFATTLGLSTSKSPGGAAVTGGCEPLGCASARGPVGRGHAGWQHGTDAEDYYAKEGL